MDGVLVGAGSLWPHCSSFTSYSWKGFWFPYHSYNTLQPFKQSNNNGISFFQAIAVKNIIVAFDWLAHLKYIL
jgi:hypothetical protein